MKAARCPHAYICIYIHGEPVPVGSAHISTHTHITHITHIHMHMHIIHIYTITHMHMHMHMHGSDRSVACRRCITRGASDGAPRSAPHRALGVVRWAWCARKHRLAVAGSRGSSRSTAAPPAALGADDHGADHAESAPSSARVAAKDTCRLSP